MEFKSVENSDVVILINMQRRKKDGALFLSFMCVKQRYYQPDRTYFNQPFDTKTFNLVDDIMDDKPKGLISLTTDFEEVDMDAYTNKGRKIHTGSAKTVNVVNDVFDLSPL